MKREWPLMEPSLLNPAHVSLYHKPEEGVALPLENKKERLEAAGPD